MLVPLEVALTVAVGAVTVFLCRRAKSFPAAFTLCIFAGLLVAGHSYIQDCALLLLIPLFLQPEASSVRQLSMVLLTPFPYFLLMAEGPLGLIMPVAAAALVRRAGGGRLRADSAAEDNGAAPRGGLVTALAGALQCE